MTDAAASSAGDLTVELNDDILLEIFADSSSEVCWRILARGENADLRLSSEGGALCALQVVCLRTNKRSTRKNILPGAFCQLSLPSATCMSTGL